MSAVKGPLARLVLTVAHDVSQSGPIRTRWHDIFVDWNLNQKLLHDMAITRNIP